MSKYCGSSPCDRLLASRAHGRWLFDATPNGPELTPVILVGPESGPERLEIEYCPFCGTKIDTRRHRERSEFIDRPRRRLNSAQS